MAPNPTPIPQKRTLSMAFTEQWQLEKAIQVVLHNQSTDTQISLLGKLYSSFSEDNPRSFREMRDEKKHWRHLLGKDTDFGFFSNPEIGTIFTVGPLVGTFLRDVEGTKLAELSAGPYGILRGLGITSDQAAAHIKTLVKGGFLLIVRDNQQVLQKLRGVLLELDC